MFCCDLAFDDIPVTLHQLAHHDVQEQLNDIANKQMDLSQYNWTLDIFSGHNTYHFIFHFSDVIADGLSMMNIVHELIHTLDQNVDYKLVPNVMLNGCERYLEDSITIADWHERATALPKPIITLNACQDNQA